MALSRKHFRYCVHCLFIQSLLIVYLPLFTILRSMVVNKIGKVPTVRKLIFWCRRQPIRNIYVRRERERERGLIGLV